MKKELLARFFVPFFLILLSCDFEAPQKFETPTWNLPLTMPLINEEYSLSGLSSPTNMISVDSLTNTFVIAIDTSIITYEDRITIGDELFFVAESSAPTPDITIPTISSDLFDIEIPSIPISIRLSDLGSSFSNISCFGNQFMEPISSSNSEVINLFSSDDVASLDMIKDLHYLTLGSGSISADIINSLPWQIDSFNISIFDTVADTLWSELIFSNISGADNKSNNLADKSLPGSITISTSYSISGDTINDGHSNSCYQIISDDIKINYTACADLDTANLDCLSCEASGFDTNSIACTLIDIDNCNSQDAPNSFTFGTDDYQLEDTEYIWSDNECFLAVPGVSVTSSDALSIEINFDISTIKSLTAHIEIEETIDNPIDFSLGNGVSIIRAHMADKGIENPDTNRILFSIDNNLFSDINFDFGINEFVNIKNGDTTSFSSSNIIAKGNSLDLNYNISDYYILNRSGGEISQISLFASIGFSDENATILFDYDYSFGIDATIKTFELDAVNVKLEEFNTPDLPVASIPAGFSDFQLPTLSFNLIFYNQIDVPVTLILDIMGVTGDETLAIHVEPSLSASTPGIETDTTIISFYSDTMKVSQNNIIEYTQLVDQNNQPVSIFDLFGYDELAIGGRAALDGEGSLERGKSVWGDVSIRIEPFTLILPNDMEIVTQNTLFSALDTSIATKINNGLIESKLYMDLENHTSLSGEISMMISNSSFFPLCIDSLVSGSLDDQYFSSGCLSNIIESLSPDSIIVDSIFNGNIHQVRFINEIDTFFFGRLLNLELPEANKLDEQGFVLQSGYVLDSILMGDMEIKWLTRQEDMYISPKMLINSSESDVNESGWRSFKTTDYLGVTSFITFILNTAGLSAE